MNHIPPLKRSEDVYGSDIAASGGRIMLRQEQKSVDWMIDFIAKFSAPEDLVINFCTGKMEVVKACLPLFGHFYRMR